MQKTREQILERLASEPATGPDLANDLGISRAAVWKHVEALRDGGFVISSDDDGYVLESVPEFGADAVEFGLDVPFEIEYHERIESTNARARELAGAGDENVVVLSDTQTGGRGRLDRDWVSPSGGIWLSVLIRPTVPTFDAPVFTLAAAVATVQALEETGVDAGIKWPNDVLVGNRKVAGILTEMEGEADRVSWLVVGIGINANVDIGKLPTDRGVTSLEAETGPVDRRAITQRLLSAFYQLQQRPDDILTAWRTHAVTLGQRVRVTTPDGEVVGNAVDIEYPGALLVETETGRERVTVGDCEHLRPAA